MDARDGRLVVFVASMAASVLLGSVDESVERVRPEMVETTRS